MKWTKAYRKTVGKELAVDPAFEFEKKRHCPVKYSRQVWLKSVEAMKQVEEIKQKRQAHFIMQRLRKAREIEQQRDVKHVHRDLQLLRADAAGVKQRLEDDIIEEEHIIDDEMEAVEAAA